MCMVDSRETGPAESITIAAERSQPRRKSDGTRARDQLWCRAGYYACFASAWR